MTLVGAGFAVIAVGIAAAFLVAIARVDRANLSRAALLTAIWLGGWYALASAGVLARFDARPPPFVGVFVATLAVAAWIGFSRLGARLATLPLAALVGLQAFRLPLELVMHQAAADGLMAVQMTFGAGGCNYDIVTGATALLLAPFADRVPRWVVAAWGVLGSVLLTVIVAVAVLSTPVFGLFGRTPDRLNTFVAHPPYVWLPVVMVGAAIAGHIIVFRALKKRSS